MTKIGPKGPSHHYSSQSPRQTETQKSVRWNPSTLSDEAARPLVGRVKRNAQGLHPSLFQSKTTAS